MTDGNEGGADATGTTTGTTGLSGSGTGQTAEPGRNPTDAGTAGNDGSKINEATGAKAAGASEVIAENGQDSEKVAEQRRDEEKVRQHVVMFGDGAYDRGAGRVLSGSVEVTDGNGIVVTKTLG